MLVVEAFSGYFFGELAKGLMEDEWVKASGLSFWLLGRLRQVDENLKACLGSRVQGWPGDETRPCLKGKRGELEMYLSGCEECVRFWVPSSVLKREGQTWTQGIFSQSSSYCKMP